MLFLRLKGLLGLFIFILIAYLLSENKKRIDWRLVLWGLGLQFIFALLILKTQIGFIIFDAARIFMTKVILFSNIGAEFLLGRLVTDQSIGAVLLVFISTIGMFDFILNQFGWSFNKISSYLFWPVAYIIGVPSKDCFAVGELLGIKVIFNEFISYLRLKPMIEARSIDTRSIILATYALCSFANFGSIAILIGGIGGLIPERRSEVAALGIRALIAGAIAGFMTAAVVGMLI